MNARVLVLDTGYQPLGVISWQRAMTLWCKGVVEIVQEYSDLWVHSAREAFKVPSIIKFVKNVFKKVRKVRFSRENIYARDKSQCQYCEKKLERHEFTLDHIVSRANGGITEWTNVVVCCMHCNRQKADKTLQQAGMKLLNKPIKPESIFQTIYWQKGSPESWKDYLTSTLYWHGELDI